MSTRLTTTSEYTAALREIEQRGIAPSVRRMLNTHYSMTDRIATMRHLAEAAGFDDYKAANRLYGSFAGRVRRNLELRYEGLSLWTIATWPAPPVDGLREFAFQMRPEFAAALEGAGMIEKHLAPPDVARKPRVALEGELRRHFAQHRRRERWLREAKIADASSRSPDGRLRCQVPGCAFDFEAQYGSLGKGYMQVHHLQPLTARIEPEETRLEDLVLVCPNCHAMIHRGGENRDLKSLRG